MEKELNEPILIIKTTWGGRSLNTEFRPPSAGPYKLPKQIQDAWDKHPQGAHGISKLEDRKQWQEDKDADSGVFYRMMIEHVNKVLADPKRVCPAYDPKEGYELARFGVGIFESGMFAPRVTVTHVIGVENEDDRSCRFGSAQHSQGSEKGIEQQ